MKHHSMIVFTLYLAFILVVEGGKNKKNRLKEIGTKLDDVLNAVEDLQDEREDIHNRLDEIETILNQLNETCCPVDETSDESDKEVIQWVSRVTGYSSQYNDNSWGANQVVGPPNVYPRYGDIVGTWASKVRDANQYIVLEFEEAVFISKLDIYETFNAGGVKAVFGKDSSGQWQQLWEADEVTVIGQARIFSLLLQNLGFRTKDIRIEVDCTASGSWVEIDAVQMSGTRNNPNE